MHEKKDVWKTDGIGIGWGYGIVGLRDRGGNSGTSTADSKAETSASSGAETSSEKNQSPLDGQTLFRRIAAISGLWIHRGGGFTICNAEFPYL